MTIVVAMAHRGTEAACRRHLPYWRTQGFVRFFSPTNSVIDLDDAPIWKNGRAGHHGIEANQRFLAMLNRCIDSDGRSFIVQEYDSVCFAPVTGIPEDHIAGIAFRDTRPERPFIGSMFLHPPLFFSRRTCEKLVRVLTRQHEPEGFFWDRWLGLACERAAIPVHDLNALRIGYSQNTVRDPAPAIDAVRNGAVCFHGIKSRIVFDAIKEAGNW